MGALHNQNWEEACRIYILEGKNKTEAYRRAFPKSRSRNRIQSVRACELFKRDIVKQRLSELQEIKTELAKREFEVDARYVLRRLVEIDRMDVIDIIDNDDTLKPIAEWPLVWRQFIQQFDVEELFAGKGDKRLKIGLLKKVKWPDKIRNLELLGKHIDVNAFKYITELQGPGGGPIQTITTTMSAKEAAEAYADTLHNE